MSKSSLRIGAIGWWSYDNQGDLRMLATLTQGLAPHQVVPVDIGFPFHHDSIYRLNQLDFVLLGGGTLIPGIPAAPFDTFEEWADQLNCPLGVVGLGVDAIQEHSWPAVNALLERARFFYVRDRASKAFLHNHPKVQIAPDLTFAYPLRTEPVKEQLPGSTPKCGVHLRKSPGLDPRPWLDAISRLPVEVRGIPLSSFDFWSEVPLLRQLDPRTPDRSDLALYQQIDLMIATAFHGVLFAVQAGVPIIAINYSPKVRHFMAENGLDRYLLSPNEYDRLPRLVDEVLTSHLEIRKQLQLTTERLHLEARQNVKEVKDQIEQVERRSKGGGPKVTVIVIKTGLPESDERTLNSCIEQTYPNVELLISTSEDARVNSLSPGETLPGAIGSDSRNLYAAPLRRALSLATGDYVTWINSGDWFAKDALECLVSLLESGNHLDLVYADYYLVDDRGLPVGRHWVANPSKLFRRDVVGPCFLMRKPLLVEVGLPSEKTPLPAYELWLRIKNKRRLLGFHAPLFYSLNPTPSQRLSECERIVRQNQRKNAPLVARILWQVIDSDLFERLVVQPFIHFVRFIKKAHNVRH